MTIENDRRVETVEAGLEQMLGNFRESVRAWSDAEYGRTRAVRSTAAHRTWRMAVVWALGLVVAVGGLGGGLMEHRHRLELARAAADREARLAQAAAAQAAGVGAPVEHLAEAKARVSDEELLSAVDSDVSRVAPSSMEPLAQLMDDGGSR